MAAAAQLVHHGMIYIPLGYSAGMLLQSSADEVCGGSNWGAGTMAGAPCTSHSWSNATHTGACRLAAVLRANKCCCICWQLRNSVHCYTLHVWVMTLYSVGQADVHLERHG